MLSTLDAAAWVRRGEWMVYLYPWHEDSKPRGIEPLSEGFAADSVDAWFPIDDHHWYFTRDDLGRLFQRTTSIYGDLYLRTTEDLRRWLRGALLEREVVAYQWRHLSFAEPMEVLAADLLLPLASRRESSALAPRVANPTDTHKVFGPSGPSVGLPDAYDESCPNPAWRSESAETASPEVISWLKLHMSDRYRGDRDQWNYNLGSSEGGGFLAGSTRVTTILANSEIWRFYGGASGPAGGWWSREPYKGDPREFSALPPSCTGAHLVRGVTTEDINVLEGVGAPRCTNKPGGPTQLLLAYGQWGHPETKKVVLS